jgi:hypothetical protein
MKSHLNSLLQPRHTPADGGRNAHRISNAHRPVGLQPKDGYDWLHQIKQARASHVIRRPLA